MHDQKVVSHAAGLARRRPARKTDQVIIAANPRAGARSCASLVQRLAEHLRDEDFSVEIITDLAKMAAQANRLHEEGRLRALVAAGGDGTVAEIVNRTEPGTPIAILPLGTANLLAGYLGIRPSVHNVVQTIVRGRIAVIDAGRAQQRIFLLMIGCGFDADVVHRLHGQRTGHISYWSYAQPILSSVRTYDYPELRVYCDGAAEGAAAPDAWQAPIAARWAFITNLPRYGAGLQFSPAAVGADGLLDVCTFAQGSLWHGLRYLAYVAVGRQTDLKDCKTARATRLRIESERQNTPYQLDGDPGGFLPLDIEVLPRRLTLLVPTNCTVLSGGH